MIFVCFVVRIHLPLVLPPMASVSAPSAISAVRSPILPLAHAPDYRCNLWNLRMVLQLGAEMSEDVILAAGGDISMGREVAEQVERRGAGFVLEAMADVLGRADLFTANWESPILVEGKDPPEKGLVVPERSLADLSLPVPAAFTMANNHCFDAGEDGIAFTRGRLDALGLSPFGAAADDETARAMRVVEVNGLRIGFLGRTEDCPQLKGRSAPGPALIKRKALMADLTAARDSGEADVLVVHLHQGVEFVDWPNPRLVDLARSLVDAGADLVLCHHPHVPQGWERYNDRLIFYSLGNLAFNVFQSGYQRQGSDWTNRSFVALIPLREGAVGEPDLVPYRITELGRPVPLAGHEAKDLLDHVATISTALADRDELLKRWRDTCIRYLGINLDWAMSAFKSDTPEELLNTFFARFGYDELRGVLRDLFAGYDWTKRLALEQWEEED